MSLNGFQRGKAVIQNAAPEDIVTGNKVEINPLSPVGVTAAEMTQLQRDLLMKVVNIYISKMTDDIAADRLSKVQKAGIEKIAFAWAEGIRTRQETLQPDSGPDFSHRTRQLAKRREPCPLRLA